LDPDLGYRLDPYLRSGLDPNLGSGLDPNLGHESLRFGADPAVRSGLDPGPGSVSWIRFESGSEITSGPGSGISFRSRSWTRLGSGS